ncbi:MAG TPA: hypothetical protein V6D47_21370 [Oscillatoriaceae cyanobacterium]
MSGMEAAPHGMLEWAIAIAGGALMLATLYWGVRMTIDPREDAPAKYLALDEEV